MVRDKAPQRRRLAANVATIAGTDQVGGQVVVGRGVGHAIAGSSGKAATGLINRRKGFIPESTCRQVQVSHLVVTGVASQRGGCVDRQAGWREAANHTPTGNRAVLCRGLRGQAAAVQRNRSGVARSCRAVERKGSACLGHRCSGRRWRCGHGGRGGQRDGGRANGEIVGGASGRSRTHSHANPHILGCIGMGKSCRLAARVGCDKDKTLCSC